MNCVGAVLLGRHARPRQGGEEPPSLWDARLERWTSLQRQPDDLAQSEADLAQSERWTSLQGQPDDLREEIEGPINWTTTMRIPLDLVVDEILAPRPGDPSLPAAAVGTAAAVAEAGRATTLATTLATSLTSAPPTPSAAATAISTTSSVLLARLALPAAPSACISDGPSDGPSDGL
jgi:hypothetical protein